MVLAENIFAVFEEICVFREKMHFYSFSGKYVLWVAVWTEKVSFEVLAGKVFLTEKVFFCDFGGKNIFAVLAGKYIFWFWRENTFSGFGGKMCFSGFGGKMHFPVLAGKCVFPVLGRKCVFRF